MTTAEAVLPTGRRERVTFDSQPLASGGEGTIHAASLPSEASRQLLVKLYASIPDAARRQAKIEYLIQQPPPNEVTLAGTRGLTTPLVAWPLATVELQRRFAGYLMPYVQGAIQLQELASASNDVVRRHGPMWKRFMHGEPESHLLRLKLARNLAACVAHVHASQRYVLVDLKPANVLVQTNGLVTLVDIDSVQVAEGPRLLYEGPVATPAYTPPEGQQAPRAPGSTAKAPSWDVFSLGVMLYELVVGMHPFGGPCKDPRTGQELSLPEEKIAARLFVHGSGRGVYPIVAKPHARFLQLPVGLQQLFMQTFEADARTRGRRPDAASWYHELNRVVAAYKTAPTVRARPNPSAPPSVTATSGPATPVAPSVVAPVPSSSPPRPPRVAPKRRHPKRRLLIAGVMGGAALWGGMLRRQDAAPPDTGAAAPAYPRATARTAVPSMGNPAPTDTDGMSTVASGGALADSAARDTLGPFPQPVPAIAPMVAPAIDSAPVPPATIDAPRPELPSRVTASECGEPVVCVFVRPDAESEAYRVDRQEPVVKYEFAQDFFLRVTFRNGREGFVRTELLEALKLPRATNARP